MFQLINKNQTPEKRRFIHSLLFPFVSVLLMISVRLIEDLQGWDLSFLGVRPLSLEGLPGIILMPFVHSSWQHLFNNVVSYFILTVALFFFYRSIAWRVMGVIWVLAGAWLWFGGRDAWHVGASGLVYGLTAFLFISGIIRRYIPLMAVALFVVFLYGSLVWGMFPLAPNLPHSWEGHLWGFMAGLSAAIVYRKEGPQRPESPPDESDDDDDDTDADAYWKVNIS